MSDKQDPRALAVMPVRRYETITIDGKEAKLGTICNEPDTGLCVVEYNNWGFKMPVAFFEAMHERNALRAALEDERAAVVAYLRDRAGQYPAESGIGAALGEVSSLIKDGEHVAAMKHGELDDLLPQARAALDGEGDGKAGT